MIARQSPPRTQGPLLGTMVALGTLCVMLTTVPATAATKTTIAGKVVDGFGQPVPGVRITVANSAFEATTNANGDYAVESAPGPVAFFYQKAGYSSARLEMELAAAPRTSAQPVTLWPVPPQPGMWFLGQAQYRPLTRGTLAVESKEFALSTDQPISRTSYLGCGMPTALAETHSLVFLDNDPAEQRLVHVTESGALLTVESYLAASNTKVTVTLPVDDVTEIAEGLALHRVTVTPGRYAFATIGRGFQAVGFEDQRDPIIDPVFLFEIRGVVGSGPPPRQQPGIAQATAQYPWGPKVCMKLGLSKLGIPPDDAIPVLTQALAAADADVQETAVQALAEFGPERADVVQALHSALRDRNPLVRANAGRVFSSFSSIPTASVSILLQALEDPEASVRATALQALHRVGAREKALLSAFINALEDRSAIVREVAVRNLRDLGPAAHDAVTALVNALGDVAPSVRAGAAEALSAVGPTAQTRATVPALVHALTDGDPGVRKFAAEGLGTFGPEARTAFPALVNLLSDADVGARKSAARGVMAIVPAADTPGAAGSVPSDAVPILIGVLADDDPSVRAAAATALATMGPRAEQAIPVLMQALDDAEALVRVNAAYALGVMGPVAKDALPALIQKITHGDNDEEVRGAVIWALFEIDPSGNPIVPGGKIGAFRHGTLVMRTPERTLVRAPRASAGTYTHPGIDLVADCGSPIYALGDGEVVNLIHNEQDPDFRDLGFMALIKHEGGETYSLYLHLMGPPEARLQQSVLGGETVVGKVGRTGVASGVCQTHIEIRHFPSRYFADPEWNQPGNIYGKGDQHDERRFREGWDDPLALLFESLQDFYYSQAVPTPGGEEGGGE